MTNYQLKQLEEAENILLDVFWSMRDNKQDKSQLKRLDTILGKIDQLKHSEREELTRDQTISKLFKMANQLVKNYTWELYSEMWGVCNDWNGNHPDQEIFMGETSDDDDNVNGFMIEDDVWYWKD